MRSFVSVAAFLTGGAAAAAIPSAAEATVTAAAAVAGNPFSGYQLYVNPYYASEVSASALPSMTGAAETAASKAAEVPSFYWLLVHSQNKQFCSSMMVITDGFDQGHR